MDQARSTSEEKEEFPYQSTITYGKTSYKILPRKSISKEDAEQTLTRFSSALEAWVEENNYDFNWDRRQRTRAQFEILKDEEILAEGRFKYSGNGQMAANNLVSHKEEGEPLNLDLKYKEEAEEVEKWLDEIAFWQ